MFGFKGIIGIGSWSVVLTAILVMLGFFTLPVLLFVGAVMSKFFACVGLLCLLFPPLLGLVLGVAFFLGLWWLFFKLIGG